MYTRGIRKRYTCSLGLNTTVFQAEIYHTKACVMERENSYTGRNIYIPSDSQAASKALYNFQINSKLVLDCHQSPVKLAEHNRIQLVWVPGNKGTDRNEMANQSVNKAPHIHLLDLTCIWYICNACQVGYQGLDEQKT